MPLPPTAEQDVKVVPRAKLDPVAVSGPLDIEGKAELGQEWDKMSVGVPVAGVLKIQKVVAPAAVERSGGTLDLLRQEGHRVLRARRSGKRRSRVMDDLLRIVSPDVGLRIPDEGKAFGKAAGMDEACETASGAAREQNPAGLRDVDDPRQDPLDDRPKVLEAGPGVPGEAQIPGKMKRRVADAEAGHHRLAWEDTKTGKGWEFDDPVARRVSVEEDDHGQAWPDPKVQINWWPRRIDCMDAASELCRQEIVEGRVRELVPNPAVEGSHIAVIVAHGVTFIDRHS